MDPGDPFAVGGFFKWDPRLPAAAAVGGPQVQPSLPVGFYTCGGGRAELEEMFHTYGVRVATVEKIGELGFTASTLVGMTEEELDDMMAALSHVFHWDLLVGERYGIKAAVRAERRRLIPHYIDALSQEEETAASGGEGGSMNLHKHSKPKHNRSRKKKKSSSSEVEAEAEAEAEEEEEEEVDAGGGGERQREHPFIVTEPGEVARGKKNGLDYLFHLYDQCREFLRQVQAVAKERGEKCPTKVTNQVFRYAKRAGASYINKPKMRHYVHCYALHCLDEEASNSLRRAYKERGENVGAWRQACYRPLVLISAAHAWDVDAVFNAHPRLAIWYVPTKLRQLCHLARSHALSSSAASAAEHPPSFPRVFRQPH